MDDRINVWWIRRDFRLRDNTALQCALSDGIPVVPLFIMDPALWMISENRRRFLMDGLLHLDMELRFCGSRLIIREGKPLQTIRSLSSEINIKGIYAEEDYSPFARKRDGEVAENLPLILCQGASVFHPLMVHKPNGSPYTVFTPFAKAWQALPQPSQSISIIPRVFPPAPELASVSMDNLSLPQFQAGEAEARRRLGDFLKGPIHDYHEGRNRLDWDGTSLISPYLRFGMLSPREVFLSTRSEMDSAQGVSLLTGCETWIKELIWREFYQSILYHFPAVLREAFIPALRDVQWRDDPGDLHAWQQGLTGYPVVDAAMRQLDETGWMHNRARMIAASFLVKDLLINWQAGEAWFMQHLVDGDPPANNGGWQWVAGVGTDAAPYFRVFNPTSQGLKHDPTGEYVRRWVPELRRVKLEFIHSPWLMPEEEQSISGCRIGRDYPGRLVDHADGRDRALLAYNQAYQRYKQLRQRETI